MSAYSEEHSDLLPLDDEGEFLQHSTLLVDGNKGIYLPQIFIETYYSFIDPVCHTDKIEGDIALIRYHGPDDQFYWHAWDAILDNVRLILPGVGGDKTYTLYQDGDLFAVPVSVD